MTTLIGRDRELNALKQALEGARQSAGCCCMIVGEAGIGKSRLVQELKSQAAQDGFQIEQGSCFQQDASFPYAPWIDALRASFASMEAAEIAELLGPLAPELVKLIPELAALIPTLAPSPALEPQAEKYRLFDSFARLGSSMSASNPLLFILEDLHWADAVSLELMQYLARRIRKQPFMLVGTCRDEKLSPPLLHLLSELSRERLVQEIILKPLNRDEVERMTRALLETRDRIPSSFVDALLEITEGNPFFVEETLKNLTEEGRVDQLLHQKTLDELHVPRSIQWMVEQRFEQLPETTQRILIHASVLGQRFDFGLLQETTAENEPGLLHALKESIAADLIVQESADQFAFKHALTRDAVYSMAMLRERKVIHRSIGEALERLAGTRVDAPTAQLAYHFYQAGAWQKAMEYSQRAGERAQALYAPREAVTHFTRALEAAQHLELAPPFLLLRGRAQAQEVLGEFDLARADYENALELALRGTDRVKEWQARIDLGLLWQSRDLERAGDYYREALELARHIEDPALLAQSLNRIGNWHMNQGQAGEALSFHRDALELFRQRADRQGIAQTLDLLGIASYVLGDPIQGVAYLEQAVPIFRELNDRQGLVNVLINLTFRAVSDTEVLGKIDYLQLTSLSDQALQIAHGSNWRQGEVLALMQGAISLERAGEYGQALERLTRAQSMVEEGQDRELSARCHFMFGTIHQDLLGLAEAQQHFETAFTVVKELGSGLLLFSATAHLASVALLQNDFARARALLDGLLPAEYRKRQELLPQRGCWSVRAELELVEGNARLALEIVDGLLASTPNLAQYGPHAVPSLSRLRGRALEALGRMEEAKMELQGALVVAQEQGRRALMWRLHAGLGKVQRALGRREDAEREFSLARDIIANLANRLPEGALQENFLQRALATMPAPHVPTTRQVAKRESGGLTAREREIAALIAQAKSNREIADMLVISEKTAERHVANILLKLGFNSRTQIAVWAVERGLAQ